MRKRMYQTMSRLSIGLGVILILLIGGRPVQGASLPPGLVIGDSDGFSITSEGAYFIELENVMPGDSFTKDISIRNVSMKEGFELTLLAKKGTGSGPIDFTKVVDVVLVQDDKTLYDGGLLGNESIDWTKSPLVLGYYTSGAESNLTVTFTVSSQLGKDDYKLPSDYKFQWVFSATAKPKAPGESEPKLISADTKGKVIKYLPKTGEEWEQLLYKVCAGLFIIVIALLLKKRHDNEKETNSKEGQD